MNLKGGLIQKPDFIFSRALVLPNTFYLPFIKGLIFI